MSERPYFARPWFRIATLVFGIFLSCLGIYVLFVVPGQITGVILGLALIVLGVESVVSAFRSKLSWLARIGPLP